MSIRRFLAAVAVVFLPGSALAVCQSAFIVDDMRDSVVKLQTDTGVQQSGVVVAQDRVVTVWHGLDGATEAKAHIAGRWRPAEVVLYDPESDLALLSVSTRASAPVTLLDRQLAEGEAVWAFGWPADRFQTMGEGIYLGDWQGSLRVTSLVQAGQSGGALIACHAGRALLAGLVTGFGAREIAGTLQREPNMTLAVPADRLLAFFSLSQAVAVESESTQ